MTSSPVPTDRIISVAVPVPGLGVLSYRAPGTAPLHKGARVRVPLGGRSVIGCIADAQAQAPADQELRDILEIIDDEAFVPPDVVELALWVGEYYASGPGGALALAMPPAARSGDRESFKTVRVFAMAVPAVAPTGRVGAKQQAAMAWLLSRPAGATAADAAKEGVSAAALRSLVSRGVALVRDEVVMRDPFMESADGGSGRWSVDVNGRPEPELTLEQADAFRRLEDAAVAHVFKTILLQGVTGSGKTELYLRLTRRVIASGRRVLILVPEIGLTPSVVGQFRARFGDRVAIQHSAL